MKKSRRNFVDKQNYLIQNILTNSREGSRRKLKSIGANSADIRSGRVSSHRYNQPQSSNETDTIELPTFGDWKSQFKFESLKQKKNGPKLHHIQVPVKTLSTEEEEKSEKANERFKLYEQSKLKQLADTKLKFQSLIPIGSSIRPQLQDNEPPRQAKHPVMRSREHSLSSRAKALSLEFQANFQTIDANLQRIVNRKQIFKEMYLRQKCRYEEILRRYNIQEEVDDHEFESYFQY